MTYLRYLECSLCGKQFVPDRLQTVCGTCGKPLFARYDLEAVAKAMAKDVVAKREPSMWRYLELMPVIHPKHIVSLGEGGSPLLHAERLGKDLGMKHLYVKDEGQLPTGSFKARGLSAAVTKAQELGAGPLAIPSAGNAAGALAAYAARAGIEAYIFMPQDAPDINKIECQATGARVTLVDGLITDAGKIVAGAKDAFGWWDVSTLKEPYRVEGKKTMGIEMAEQMNWQLPDVVVYPTGGGTGIIGMWKAFDELETIGWIGPKRPRMIAVQSEGCAPIVQAYEAGAEEAAPFPHPSTVAAGIRVPQALGDFLILRAVRKSGGTAVAVSDPEIMNAVGQLAQSEGIFAAPEGAATLAGLRKLIDREEVGSDERVVLFNTGSGLKYPNLIEANFPVVNVDAGPEELRRVI